jgi:hypothetical protein
MNDKNVIISEDRLAVVLAYLADKAPEGLVQRREWARCMAILSAQRKEAPGAIQGHDCDNCDKELLCARCGKKVEVAYREKQEAPTRAQFPAQTLTTNATLCAQSNCATFAICARNVEGPCGLYDHVTATPPNQYDPATVAFPAYAADIAALRSEFEELKQIDADSFMTILGRVSDLRDIAEALDATTKAHELKTHERELNEVIDSLSARMDALSVQLAELDKDHVDLLKTYIHHLREHMPEALRNAGEVPLVTKEELAKAIAAHEVTTAEHFQGQIDTLSRVVDEDRKAVVTHERELHNPTGKGEPFPQEPKTCKTCHHHAVCRKSDICCSLGNVGCESWEGQHPK